MSDEKDIKTEATLDTAEQTETAETVETTAPTPAPTPAPTTHRLTVDTGLEAVEICNLQGEVMGTLYFHPADIGIIDRWNEMAKNFAWVTEPLDKADASGTEAYEALTEAKKRLCQALDNVFGGNFSEACFSKVHPFALVNGRFYCENLLDAVGAYIGQKFQAEIRRINRAKNDRMRAYTAPRASRGRKAGRKL